MARVQGDAGRTAAGIIATARERHMPRMTTRDAARKAGVSREGWDKILRNGRGSVDMFLAMARAVGVEREVREALGLPPADVTGPDERVAAGVPPAAGRMAADIIKAAQERQVPVLTVAEAARRAGITDEGWAKVIRTGRGRQSTFLAMARVAGAERAVREALGIDGVTGPDERVAAFEASIEANAKLSAAERRAILKYMRSGGGREDLIALLTDSAPPVYARTG